MDGVTVTGRLMLPDLESRTYTVAVPGPTPRTVSTALFLDTFDNATVTTAVFFDSAWISPRALLICTVALPPTATVTFVGESVSAEASAANNSEHNIVHDRKIHLMRGVA